MPRELLIVGGGMIGLSAAYLAAKSGASVTVLEADTAFGGLLKTFAVGDTWLEHYYHHFFQHDDELRWLLDELDLTDQLAFFQPKMGLFYDGRVHDFGAARDLLTFPHLGLIDKFRFALSSLYLSTMADWRKYEEMSALAWLKRYAGDSTSHLVWRPLMEAKFGASASEVPLSWLVGRLRQRFHSRRRGVESLGYLQGSLRSLLTPLLERLEQMGARLVPQARVETIETREQEVSLKTSGGQVFRAEQVLFALPAPALAKVLQDPAPQLAGRLAQIRYLGVVVVVLELTQPLSDIYWLNISDGRLPFTGIIEHTNLVPPQIYGGRHIVYLSKYFTLDSPLAQEEKREIARRMIDHLTGIRADFDRSWIMDQHVFRSLTAAPICNSAFSQKVLPVDLPLPGVFAAGMRHIYPDERSVNNSIRVAASACREMGYRTDFVPQGKSLAGQVGLDS